MEILNGLYMILRHVFRSISSLISCPYGLHDFHEEEPRDGNDYTHCWKCGWYRAGYGWHD